MSAPEHLIACPLCETPLPAEAYNTGKAEPCPGCRVLVRVETFPALGAKQEGRLGEMIVDDGQSSCFYHPQKKVEIHCEGCGRFLCALCDVTIGSEHYCPQCVEAGVTRGKVDKLQRGGLQHDKVAFGLSIVSLIPIPFAMLFVAFGSLYFAFRYWGVQESLVSRSRVWRIGAVLLAIIGIMIQTLVIYGILR